MTLQRTVVLAALVVGCALALSVGDRVAAQEGDKALIGLRQEIRQLAESVQGARQDLLVVQRTQARTLATVDELQTVVQTVDAKLEEFNHRLRELAQRLDALQASVVQRQILHARSPPAPPPEAPETPEPGAPEVSEPAEPEAAKAPQPVEEEEAEATSPETVSPQTPPAGPITRETVEVAVLDLREIFRAAHEDYVKGSYDLAILGFRDYLKRYPDTELASSAQYWLGESYLSQEAYPKAVEEFQLLLDMYPKSPKVPTAMFKQGLAFRELKRYEKAREALEAVVSQFPTTVEAKHAAEQLKDLPVNP